MVANLPDYEPTAGLITTKEPPHPFPLIATNVLWSQRFQFFLVALGERQFLKFPFLQ